MNIASNIQKIKNSLPENVTLIAISKTKSKEEIMGAYHAGQRIFGENRVQELEIKQQQLPKNIEWHMVGHLQRNKVKYIAPFVSMIHAVDTIRLLKEINRQAKSNHRVIDCLLQMKIAEEDTKFGMTAKEIIEIMQSEELKEFKNIRIRGLMAMATFTEDTNQINREFETINKLYQKLKTTYDWDVLSIGMSGDYSLAIKNGSNMVRIGSSIFGERN